MKLLIIHSRYQVKSGEDSLVDMEIALLEKEHEVETLIFHNQAGLKGLFQFLVSIWNFTAARKVSAKIESCKPDIVHVHNWHFASGPLIFRTIKKAGVPLVATLHNYRLLCPSAILFHNGQNDFDSLTQQFPWKAIRKKMYRNSYLLSFWLAFIVYFHRKLGTWNSVSKYLVPSGAMLPFFQQACWKFPAERIEVKPNFTESSSIAASTRNNNFLFVGRLAHEKGIDLLLKAFENSFLSLTIIGSGPLEEVVLNASKKNPMIRFMGSQPRELVIKELSTASALIFPSIWQEPFGMVIIEALSVGTPVISTDCGAPAELIKHQFNGLQFGSNNVEQLKAALLQWSAFPDEVKTTYQKNALQSYQTRFTPQKNLLLINEKYQSCL